MSNDEQITTLAREWIENALEVCAEKYRKSNAQLALEDLRQNRKAIWGAFAEYLSQKLGDYFGKSHPASKEIYTYSSDLQSLRVHSEEKAAFPVGINLIIWANESLSVEADAAAFEAAFAEILIRLGVCDECELRLPVTVSIIQDAEVLAGRGIGVFANSKVVHSNRVWPTAEAVGDNQDSVIQHGEQDRLLRILNSYDPALASAGRSIQHARALEQVPKEQRGMLEYHLIRLKVGIIQKLISDQLFYIDIAKKWFTVEDLADIHRRRVGHGKIGGKAAGMMLAARILSKIGDEDIKSSITIPESYFLGSDLIYIFIAMNGLMHWNDQKYKPQEIIRSDYPQIQKEFMEGEFPPEILVELEEILEKVGDKPLVVRSSSQLEDNFGTIFAGKYDSVFCPNQGAPEERMRDLTTAIKQVYVSTLKPDALLYRRSRGLQDYDERMAVLIQVVQGENFGEYFLPQVAGVAFSRNLYRWSPEIKREDGFARLVWGLGTRAVGRVDDDYPRIVALSHPLLRPDDSAEAISHYSQHCVDLLNLTTNQLEAKPIHDVLTPGYKPLRYIAQLERDGFFLTPQMRVKQADVPKLAVTFDEFLKRTPFIPILKKALRLVEENYHESVDIEFTARVVNPGAVTPEVQISLLQCRPQPHLQDVFDVAMPKEIAEEDILFSTKYMVPRGYIKGIRYVLYVHPQEYFSLKSFEERAKVTSMITALNNVLDDKTFICVGPGRWGSVNTDLGVGVSYADIYRAASLVEVSGEGIGTAPEPSLGTHFFHDLMEAEIYPLALYLDDKDVTFNHEYFNKSPNRISEFIDVSRKMERCVRLFAVDDYRPGHSLEIVMDDDIQQALAFFVKNSQ